MKKDFDGSGWAKSHKSEFDDLIANARRKRERPGGDAKVEQNGDGEDGVRKKEVAGEHGGVADGGDVEEESRPHTPLDPADVTPPLPLSRIQPPTPPHPHASTTPGFNLAASLGPSPIAAPVNDATNATATLATTLDSYAIDVPASTKIWRAEGPVRRKPMFDMPGDPVVDAELGGSADGDGAW